MVFESLTMLLQHRPSTTTHVFTVAGSITELAAK
jgi:hypothetical protein